MISKIMIWMLKNAHLWQEAKILRNKSSDFHLKYNEQKHLDLERLQFTEVERKTLEEIQTFQDQLLSTCRVLKRSNPFSNLMIRMPYRLIEMILQQRFGITKSMNENPNTTFNYKRLFLQSRLRFAQVFLRKGHHSILVILTILETLNIFLKNLNKLESKVSL